MASGQSPTALSLGILTREECHELKRPRRQNSVRQNIGIAVRLSEVKQLIGRASISGLAAKTELLGKIVTDGARQRIS